MGDSNRRPQRLERTVLAAGVALLVVTSLVATAPTGSGAATLGLAVGQPDPSAVAAVQQTTTARSDAEFAPTVFGDVAGQVAVEDGTVTVRGTATGTDQVLVVLFDRRGRVLTELLSVNDADVFEEEDLALVTGDGTPLAEGRVVATVLSPGRDGMVGDGELSGVSRADLTDFEAAFRETARQVSGNRSVVRTQRQLVELFYDQTVEDSGSDDLLLAEEFVYADGRTTIERVFPRSQANRTGPGRPDRTATVEPIRVGDAMVVRGLTNRRPDDNTILVEVVDGPSADAFDLYATDSWGTDGVWQVEIDASNVEPGTYTFEADTGDSVDAFRVRILPREAESTGNATESTGNTTEPQTTDWRYRRFCRGKGRLTGVILRLARRRSTDRRTITG